MNETPKIALLIDADNTPFAKLDDIIREISTRGRIILKRAYGNWQKETLKNWNASLKRLAIKAEQQFDYVSGKNATDIALVVDAISLLNTEIYDTFVISASDSDYTPLAVRLRESGAYVIGIGEKKAPEPFRNSCDEFLLVDDLGNNKFDLTQEEIVIMDEADENSEIHELLKMAAERYKDENGFVYVGTAGMFIKKVKPDFDVKTLGYSKLTQLIEAYPNRYEIKGCIGDGNSRIVGYKYRVIAPTG